MDLALARKSALITGASKGIGRVTALTLAAEGCSVHLAARSGDALETLRNEILATHKDLARKLDELERRYDAQFKVVFDAIRQLMTPPLGSKRRIGFAPWDDSSQ